MRFFSSCLVPAAVVLLAVALSGCNGAGQSGVVPDASIRVGTYNIRNSRSDKKTPDAWNERKADMVALIRSLDLDAFGAQEVLPDQAKYLREQLPEFGFVGDHRGADRVSDEATPVFYRKSRFEAEKSGTFWLSETPDVPGSRSWGSACLRVCSYLVLRDKRTGRRFCFANTHADHKSAEAREKGMMLVIERMKEFGDGAPIVLTGDHNCREIDAPALAVSKVLKNSLYLTETTATGPWRTYNGRKWIDGEVSTAKALEMSVNVRNKKLGPRIDYIYVSDGVKVKSYATIGDSRPGKKLYPSDHFPVVAVLEMPES